MKIVDRYVVSELLPPFFLGVIGFILIMATDLLFTLIDLIINKGVPFLAVMRLLIFKLPSIMVLTFPVSTLFATAMALGRLSKDSEIIALRTSGVSLLRLSVPIVILAIFISGLAYFTNEKIVPWTNHVSENIIRQVILKQPPPIVEEDVFFKDSRHRYFYIRRFDPASGGMQDVMVYELSSDTLPRVIVAKRAKKEGDVWSLEEGVVHRYDKEGHRSFEANFSAMQINVSENIFAFTDQRTPQEMSSGELGQQIRMLKYGGVNTQALATDFHLKFSVPATALAFALLGISLGIPRIRSGRAWGVILCVIVVFGFYVFASVFRSLGRGGVLPPLFAAWIPQVTVGALGLGLILWKDNFK